MAIDIHKHFVPVIYPVGHTGNFLLNFLSPVSLISKKDTRLVTPSPVAPNHEWGFNDIFNNFFGKPLEDSAYALSKYPNRLLSPADLLAIANTIIKVKYNMILNNIDISESNLTTCYDRYSDCSNFPSDEFINDNSIRFLKSHPGFIQQDTMPFERRIFASFAPDRFLIPYTLLLYKVYTRPRSMKNIESINELVRTKSLRKECGIRPGYISMSNCQHVDMYKLVIEKDLGEIYNICPEFEFSKEKARMLDLAHESTLSILKKFEIDPTQKIGNSMSSDEVVKLENLDNLLSIAKSMNYQISA